MIVLSYTLFFAVVLSLVALGGMFSEHSGVINLGLEGTMVIGALGGALVLHYMPADANGFLIVFLSLLAAMAAGAIYSLLLALAAVTFKADQTISGTALNILAPALATVIVKAITLKETGKASPYLYYVEQRTHFIFNWGDLELSWFVVLGILAVVISYFVLYKTRFGLRLMACGEHPSAADAAGINVTKMRYTGVIISGVLGGLGGFAYIAGKTSQWPFDMGVAGFGFLALAVMIFGQWKPFFIFGGSVIFALFRTMAVVYNVIPGIKNLPLTSEYYQMLPYLVCLIVLAFTSKKSRAPKMEGIPYDKGMR